MQKFINKHPEICSISLLILLCLIFLFFGIDFYPILDTYESLYAVVSKNLLIQDDFKLLVLNMQPFLEKPPLYFWIISSSINLLETFNEFSIRIPNAIISTFLIFFTYFSGKHIMSRKLGLISAIILLTSLSFLVFSHIAIINVALTFFITTALYCGFFTSIAADRHKKFYWWGFYLFCALGVLVKGAIAILIPTLVMFMYYLCLKNIKEIFRPANFLIGLLIFFPITLPWFFEMTKIFGLNFLNQHFFAPDFKNVFKNLLYFIILFIPAFMPWIFIFIGYLFNATSKLITRFKNNAKFSFITIEQKISLFGILIFLITLFVISLLPKSNPTFILLLIPSASILTAYFICAKDISESYKTHLLSISTHILVILFTVSTLTFAFVYMFLPINIFEQVQQFKNLLIIGVNFISILMLLKLKNKNIFSIIGTYVFSMFFIIIFTIVHIFNMFYLSGENELISFSQYTANKSSQLIAFNITVKPSILINSAEFVYFIEKPDTKQLNKNLALKNAKITFVIFKNKDIDKYLNKTKTTLYLIDRGNKYSIYSTVELPGKALTRNKFYSSK